MTSNPAWGSAQANRTVSTALASQFLGTHQGLGIFEGSARVTIGVNYLPSQIAIGGASSPNFPLGDAYNIGPFQGLSTGGTTKLTGSTWQTNAFSQPFTQVGPLITRVSLPISIAKGVGQDVMVSLQTDNGTYPSGTVLAATIVPKEFQPLGNTSHQTQGQCGLNNYVTSLNPLNLIPSFPLNTVSDAAAATDGTFMAISGGLGTTNTNLCASAQIIDSVTGLGPWTTGPAIPTASAAIYLHQMSYLNGNLIVTGGNNNSGVPQTQVFVSPFTNGVISSWVAATGTAALPTATAGHVAVAVGPAQTGISTTVPTIFVISGTSNSGSGVANLNQVISNTITSGTTFTGGWTTLANFPFSLVYSAACYSNGWIIVAGGANQEGSPFTAVANVVAAKVNVDQSGTSTNGQVTLGPWQNWPSMPSSVAQGSLVSFGNTIYFTGGLVGASTNPNQFALHVTSNGPGTGWVTLNAGNGSGGGSGIATQPAVMSSNGILTAVVGTQPPLLNPVADVPVVSVPLYTTGLTPVGTTYHIVVSGMGGDPDNYSQLTVGSTAGTDGLSNQGGQGWWHTGNTGSSMLQAGTATFLQVFEDTNGKQLHTVEDTGLPVKIQSAAITASTSGTATVNITATLPGTTLIAYCVDKTKPNVMTLSTSLSAGATSPWITAFSDVDTVNNTSQLLAYYPNNPGGITAVNALVTSFHTDNVTVNVMEFSGLGPLDTSVHGLNFPATANISFTAPHTKTWDFAIAAYFDEVADGTTFTAGNGYTQVGTRFGQCFLEFTNTNATQSTGQTTLSFGVNPSVTASATNSVSHIYGGGLALFTLATPGRQTWTTYTGSSNETAGFAEQIGSIRRVWTGNPDSTGQINNNLGSNQGWGTGQWGSGSSPSLVWGS